MKLSEQDRTELQSKLYSQVYDSTVAWRAQIVLWSDEGIPPGEIAKMAGTTRPTVYKWIYRYEEGGAPALENRKSTGRPQSVSGQARARILALTRETPPDSTGLTHWSSGEMAKYLQAHEDIRVSHNFILTLWRENGLQPWRQGTFKLSRDPEFATKVADIVGLYLNPPEGAIVLSMDEKTQIQALDRTQPVLPIDFGKTEKRTHDYIRHGTTNLFAAFNTLTGKVTARCFQRRRTKEFVKFLDQVVPDYPDKDIHIIVDNLSAHSGEEIDKWNTKYPNVTFHYTPTGSSWLNQVETWFGILTRQSIRRGTFQSVPQLIKHIENYVKHWNEDAEPFEWKATADDIIGKVRILERDYQQMLDVNRNYT
jgi:transposase